MKLGAYEYLLKPLELAQLRQVVDRAVEISRRMHVPAIVAGGEPVDDRADALVGRCGAMQEVYKAIGRAASQEVTVLISGESGTGKELVARALYQHSRRAAGPFLAINCAAIPEQLLESELFGHEKGAFTGADRRRIGKFEQVSGGTVFLDEVGDMAPLTQAKMLRFLQEQRFERVGGTETIQTDVRVLAATNRDLEALVAAGKFRPDLFYRLSVFTIWLPSLRERGEDLSLLVQHYLHRFSRELGKNVQAVAPEALALLERYPWPGNVRELESVLKQALLQAAGPVLVPDFLPAALRKADEPRAGSATGRPDDSSLAQFIDEQLRGGSEGLYAEALRRMERLLLTRVLQHTGGNQLQAARILGITRGSLRTKLRDLGITIARTVGSNEGEPPRASNS
jgi:two-component system nitrogen regulation response regulator GlnG